MYNGIGLETARGSGTNGYVQRNMAFVRTRKEKVNYKTEEEIAKSEASLNREPNREILEHERKRKVEVECMEYRELMEEQGFDEETIEARVNAFRIKLLEKAEKEKSKFALDEFGRPIVTGTHQIAAANQDRNKKLRDAFGISADYIDGSSMNPDRKLEKAKKYALVKDPDDDVPVPNSAPEKPKAAPNKPVQEKKEIARKRRESSGSSSESSPERKRKESPRIRKDNSAKKNLPKRRDSPPSEGEVSESPERPARKRSPSPRARRQVDKKRSPSPRRTGREQRGGNRSRHSSASRSPEDRKRTSGMKVQDRRREPSSDSSSSGSVSSPDVKRRKRSPSDSPVRRKRERSADRGRPRRSVTPKRRDTRRDRRSSS